MDRVAERRLIVPGNVRSALLLVERGEAPDGIVYATDAAASANVAVAGTFPADSHDPINDPFAVNPAGASLACAVRSFPLMLRTVRLSFESVDAGLVQAARTLGAGPFDRSFTITLPLASPGVLVGGRVGFASCLGTFGAVITFAGGVPSHIRPRPWRSTPRCRPQAARRSRRACP